MTNPARDDWFDEVVDVVKAALPDGVHMLLLLSNDDGIGVASCCGVGSDEVELLLRRASDVAAAERLREGGEGWTMEARGNGTH